MDFDRKYLDKKESLEQEQFDDALALAAMLFSVADFCEKKVKDVKNFFQKNIACESEEERWSAEHEFNRAYVAGVLVVGMLGSIWLSGMINDSQNQKNVQPAQPQRVLKAKKSPVISFLKQLTR